MENITLLKDNELFQGALFYIEGELINVIVKEANRFNEGDSIICFMDSDQYETKVIKKQDFNLYLYFPWLDSLEGNERRSSARIPFKEHAEIILDSEEDTAVILDISIKGIGFQSEREFNVGDVITLSFILDGSRKTLDILIKNQSNLQVGYRYGGLFENVTEDDYYDLRMYILYHQLNALTD